MNIEQMLNSSAAADTKAAATLIERAIAALESSGRSATDLPAQHDIRYAVVQLQSVLRTIDKANTRLHKVANDNRTINETSHQRRGQR